MRRSGSYGSDSEGLVALARVFGADAVIRAEWTNVAGGKMCFWLVKMPSAWHAYGMYESAGGRDDESAVRGGPSKRVGRGVMVMRGRWVAWDDGGEEVTAGEREVVRRALYGRIPGVWQLPRVVRALLLMEPRPARVQFQPQDTFEMDALDAAMVAQFVSGVRTAELFVCKLGKQAPATWAYGKVRRWLQRNELLGVEVRDGERYEFFVPDRSTGYLYMVCESNRLYGVRGVESVGDARALLARWNELEQALEE